jgi:hypothetical protein
LAHFKKPFKFTSKISFGKYHTQQSCPVDKSKIDLTLSIGSPEQANTYNDIVVDDESECTKEIVKFSPVPKFDNCNASAFEHVLSINDINLEMDFDKVT